MSDSITHEDGANHFKTQVLLLSSLLGFDVVRMFDGVSVFVMQGFSGPGETNLDSLQSTIYLEKVFICDRGLFETDETADQIVAEEMEDP